MKAIRTMREEIALRRARAGDVEAMREIHWRYLAKLNAVRQVVNGNPQGLRNRPLFGTELLERERQPRPRPALVERKAA